MEGVFTFHNGPQRWEGARQACHAMGGTLASIHSREEELAIFQLINGRTSWIGMSDSAVEGEYIWADGTPRDFALTWAIDQPDDDVNDWDEDCVGYIGHDDGFEGTNGWNDFWCNSSDLSFVCRGAAWAPPALPPSPPLVPGEAANALGGEIAITTTVAMAGLLAIASCVAWQARPKLASESEVTPEGQYPFDEARSQLTLTHSVQAAAASRTRVRGWLLAFGWVLLCFGVAPMISFMRRPDERLENVTGPYPFWLILVSPAVFLVLLSVSPTDKRRIWAICAGFFCVLLALALLLVFMISDELRRREQIPPTWVWAKLKSTESITMGALTFAVLAVASSIVAPAARASFSLSPAVSARWPPRLALRRVWLTVRLTYFGMGVVLLSYQLLPFVYLPPHRHLQRTSSVFLGTYVSGVWIYAFVSFGTSLIALAVLASARSRGRFYKFVSRLGGGRQPLLQQAATIAALLGDNSAEKVIYTARSNFFIVPFRSLGTDCFELERRCMHAAGVRRQDHSQQTGSDSAAIQLAMAARLGECDAFCSHAWDDETLHPGEKFRALSEWVQARQGKPSLCPDCGRHDTALWIDHLCLGRTQIARTLPCLPIFVASCRTFLALVGEAYNSRLWTSMEIFTFLRMGGSREHIAILPITPSEESVRYPFATFDAALARCSLPQDTHTLLAIVESSFGDLRSFNKVMRGLLVGEEGLGAVHQ